MPYCRSCGLFILEDATFCPTCGTAVNASAQTGQTVPAPAAVALHLVDMGGAALDTTSATGRMMLTMLAGFAEFERALAVERTTAALRHKREHGRVYGPTPYGFARAGDELHEDPDEVATVATIRGLRAEDLSLRAIAARLIADGVPTKRGGTWAPSTVSKLLRSTREEATA